MKKPVFKDDSPRKKNTRKLSTIKTTSFGLGWIPDLPDIRDYAYAVPADVIKALPPKVDLRPQCPPVMNQGTLGSCTAHAIGSAHYFGQMRQNSSKPFQPSRLFIYYNERRRDGNVEWDSGAIIRTGFKSIAKEGVCPEELWGYDIPSFTVKPPVSVYKEALNHQVLQYMRVQQTLGQMKGCLADGYPLFLVLLFMRVSKAKR
jgi:C1A family cysteine protease